MNAMKRIGLFLLLACPFFRTAAFAQNVADREYLASHTSLTTISPDVVDDRYTAIAAGGASVNFADKNHFGLVTLGFDEDLDICYAQYAKIVLNGTATGMKYTVPGTVTAFSQTFTLEAEYDPSSGLVFSDRSSLKIPDACSLKVSVASISLVSPLGATPVSISNPSTGLLADIYLETVLQRERYYKPHPTYSGTNFSSVYTDNEDNIVELKWSQAAANSLVNYPDEYEIEWGYAHDYADTNAPDITVVPSFSFRNNASRIRVKSINYIRLSLLYDRGYLLFRIRGIWKGGPDFDEDIIGQWNTGNLGELVPAPCTDFLAINSGILVEPTDNVAGKNWISSLELAENGVHKPLVQYADGSGRVRQSVTTTVPDNNGYLERQSIITETLYDYRGRPAIQTLPVPVLREYGSIPAGSLQYIANFNLKDGTSDKYGKQHFDIDSIDANQDCVPDIPGFDNTSGAGEYYSSENTLDGIHDYVPDAQHFPFTHTVYERDNTGRIRSQSGVGPKHTTGSGHETVYQYTTPNQAELDRLFGTDVGYASHYKKNVVRDANGQYSISYLNMSGKVIATSLAGNSPDMVDPLTGERDQPLFKEETESLTVDLLNPDDTYPHGMSNPENADGTGRNMSYTFSVLQEQKYGFNYESLGKDFFDACAPDLCADCIYELKIRLTDRCGQNMLPASVTDGKDYLSQRIGGGLPDPVCKDDDPGPFEFNVVLPEGVYTLSKELTVDMAAVEYYAQKFIENNTCLPDSNAFYEPPVDCYPDCEAHPEDCEANMADMTRNFCLAAYEIMLTDMRPGGQYGFVPEEGEITGDSLDADLVTSVYSSVNLLPKRDFTCTGGLNNCPSPADSLLTDAFWRNPRIKIAGVWQNKYYEEDGSEARVPVFQDENDMWSPRVLPGTVPVLDVALNQYFVKPQELKYLEDFLAAFSYGSWEKSLLVYHPEYFFYEGCVELEQRTVTIGGQTLNTWEYEAFMADSPLPSFQSQFPNFMQLFVRDPLFQSGSPFDSENFLGISGPTYADVMVDLMGGYRQDPVTSANYNMLEFAYATAHCGGAPALASCIPPSLATAPDNDVREALVNFYIGSKQSLIYYYLYFYSLQRHNETWCIDGENVGVAHLGGSSSLLLQDPCDLWKSIFYFGKEKRFINESQVSDAHGFGNPPDTEAMMEYANQTYYNETGICPAARDLELFLKLLANDRTLAPHTVPFDVSNASYLTPLLSGMLTGQGASSPIKITSAYSNANKKLTVNVQGITCPIVVEFPGSSSFTFSNLITFQSIQNVRQSGTDYLFELRAVCASGGGQETVVLSGQTCLPITGCRGTFRAVCKVTPVANSIRTLMNAISQSGSGKLFCTSACTLPTQLLPYVDAPVTSYIGALVSGGNYTWTWNPSPAPGQWTLHNTSTGVNKGFDVKILSASPGFSSADEYTWASVQADVSTTPVASQTPRLILKGYKRGFPPPPTLSYDVELTVEIVPIGFSTIVTTDCQKVESQSTVCNTEAHQNLRTLSEWLQSSVSNGQAAQIGARGNCTVTETRFADDAGTFSWANVTHIENIGAYTDGPSADGVSSIYFTATVIYNGSTKTVIGKWCKPVRNCESCSEACTPVPNNLWFIKVDLNNLTEGHIKIANSCIEAYSSLGFYNPAYLDSASVRIIFNHGYQAGWTKIQFYQDWADSINALGIPEITAHISNGSMYISFPSDVLYNDPVPNNNWNDKCNCKNGEEYEPFLGLVVDGNTTMAGSVSHTCCLPPASVPPVVDASGNIIRPPLSSPPPAVDENGNPVLTDTEWPPQDNLVFGQNCHPATGPTDEVPYEDPCDFQLEAIARQNAHNQRERYIDSVKADYIRRYLQKCMEVQETLTMRYDLSEYHFTLYYYDRSGNLLRTVPPRAVKPLDEAELSSVVSARAANTVLRPKHNTYDPTHESWTLGTRYMYNSLDAVTGQKTPDAGSTLFWYDNLGRIILSQNAKQKAVPGKNRYGYTLYDKLGRMTETGQLDASTVPSEGTVKDPALLAAWHAGIPVASHTEVTRTWYDAVNTALTPTGFAQANLRGRVAGSALIDRDATTPFAASSVHYDYDFHGNVKNLLNVDNSLSYLNQHKKQVSYTYDLVSGKVLGVAYRAGQADAFYHRYRYDDNNRLLEAESSVDGLFWDRDAYYSYYRHGLLARTEYGQKVQGLDYTYTLQGWLKGVNSDVLNEKHDPGHDGLAGTPYAGFSRDAFSFSLFYFFGDQQPVHPSFYEAYAGPANTADELFNGNIRALTAGLRKPGTYAAQPLIQEFTYDQLNRIAKSTAYDDLDLNTNTWGGVASPAYGTSYAYDPNGNLKKVTRAGDNPADYEMDDLLYHYYPHSNRLEYIKDGVPAGNYPSDIDAQDENNYRYDEIGNLIRDKAEKIDTVEWTLYGKVKRVVFGNSKPDLEFTYSPTGQRLSKKIRPKDGAPVKILYYSHDAQGNILAVYTLSDPKGRNEAYTVDEHLIYGSSRLGVRKNGTELLTYVPSADPVKHFRGLKRYELANHLGNVQAVVSDRRNRVCESGRFSRYEPDIRNTYDYYPFGAALERRTFVETENYRFGFNGKEKENEWNGEGNIYDYGFRTYNPRIGKFLSVDPLTQEYPWYTPYQFSGNNPILFVDLDGLEQAYKVPGSDYIVPATDQFNTTPPQNAVFIKPGLNDYHEPTTTLGALFENSIINNPLTGLATSVNTLVTGQTLNNQEAGFRDYFTATANILVAGMGTGGKGKGGGKVSTPSIGNIRTPASSSKMQVSKASNIAANAKQGAAFEKLVMEKNSLTQDNLVEQITLKTQSGIRTRIDIVGKDKVTGSTMLTEAKSSIKARLTPNQTKAFPEIERTGATVVGKGKEPFTGGTTIPPTSIEIVRPSN